MKKLKIILSLVIIVFILLIMMICYNPKVTVGYGKFPLFNTSSLEGDFDGYVGIKVKNTHMSIEDDVCVTFAFGHKLTENVEGLTDFHIRVYTECNDNEENAYLEDIVDYYNEDYLCYIKGFVDVKIKYNYEKEIVVDFRNEMETGKLIVELTCLDKNGKPLTIINSLDFVIEYNEVKFSD